MTGATVDRFPQQWLKAGARGQRRRLGLASALTVLDAAPAIGFAAGLAGAIAALADRGAGATPWLLLAGVSLVARALIAQVAAAAAVEAAGAIKADRRSTIVSEIFSGRRQGPGGLSAAVEGVEALDGYYARFIPARTAAAVAPLLIIGACAVASPVAAGILLLTLLPFVAGMALSGSAAAGESRRQFHALETLSGLFLDRVRALPMLLAFQAETRTVAEIARAADELERRTNRVLKIAFLSSGVLEFFSALSVALVAVYCGFNLLQLLPFPAPETLDLARAFFVLALAPEVYAPMRRLAATYHERQAAEAAAPALADDGPAPAPRTRASIAWAKAPTIDFRQVGIRHGDGAPVVTGFDLHVPAGSLVALTGPSGSGKSSLLHLLLGLAPLSAGEVEIGGLRLSEAGPFAGAVGWASQAPIVTPGTLAENIALARRDATRGEILRAAASAGLDGDLDRRLDERGGGLSGGERRRLGLARALLSGSPVLLLDEPTANLDSATEACLLAAIRLAARGRTTILATHSAAAMALADKVVRL